MHFEQQISEICFNAKQSLRYSSSQPGNVIVFDMDDTLVNRFGCIQPVVELYKYTQEILKLEPVLITNRSALHSVINYTKQQFLNCDLKIPRIMYFRNPQINDPWKYKYFSRKDLHKKGFKVVMSIGDQPWDIGEYGGIPVQLPIQDYHF